MEQKKGVVDFVKKAANRHRHTGDNADFNVSYNEHF
jgi:hypothetical protein